MLPEGWDIRSLGDVCDQNAPITYGVLKPGDFCENGIPLLQIKDLSNGGVRKIDFHRISIALDKEYKRSRILDNDILISLVGTIGRVAKVSGLGLANIHRNIGRIRSKYHDYLFHFLNSDIALREMGATSSGSSQSALNLSTLRSMKVPLPPIPEQKKIAQILSTWDKAITTTEQLLANSQQQKKALMQQLLTGRKRLKGFSGKWQTAKLGQLTEKVGSGITPTGGSNVYASSGVPFIRSQNVLWGKLDFSDVAYINDSQHKKMSGSSVLPNDVLLNITGASIGRCCTVPEKLKTSNVNQHVCIIRPKKNISSDYLKLFLLSYYGQKQIEQFQAGGNRQGLNFEQIKSFKIHIPELEEQQAIAAVLSAADREIEVLQQKLEGLKQEKKALMQQLLTGKRRVTVDSTNKDDN